MRILAGVALGAALLSRPLPGQDVTPDEAAPPRVRQEGAVVAARLAMAAASATVRIVTREEIAAMPGVRTLPDVLQTILGLDVRRRGLDGTQADVGIRGADFNGTLLLVDGQPLGAVERIEVLAGGGSALWGSNAVGGVVNIVTRGADLGRSNMQWETRYSHGSDSLDAGGYRAAVRIGESASAAVDWHRTENAGFRDDTESSSNLLRVSGRWDTGAGPVMLGLGYASRNFGAYAFYGTTYPNQQESTRTRTAALSSTLALGGWTLTPSASVRAHHDDFVLDRNDPSFYENLHDTVTSLLRTAARHALGGGTFAFGVEAGRETISSTNLGSHGRDHGALFAEFARAWDPAASSTAGLHAGLRADEYEGYGSRFSPYAGVSWDAAQPLTLRASFGSSFRVPSFTELYYVDPQNVGNPNLRPEQAWQGEAGAPPAGGGSG